MNRTRTTILVVLVATVGGFWLTNSVIGADDPRRDGEIIKTVALPGGAVDTYRERSDGEVVIEHEVPGEEPWFESNEVVGHDGKPVICPNGEPLRRDFERDVSLPSEKAMREAQAGLPPDKRAVFNEYTGEFDVISSVSRATKFGDVTVSEGAFYRCNEDNEPELAPLSEIDPEAAKRAREEMGELLENSGEVTGLGQDPASQDPPSSSSDSR